VGFVNRRYAILGGAAAIFTPRFAFGQVPVDSTVSGDSLDPVFASLKPPADFLRQLQTGAVGTGEITDADQEIADRIEEAVFESEAPDAVSSLASNARLPLAQQF
jgi:hypothetical protein